MAIVSKVLLCVSAIMVDGRETCLGDTKCCEQKGRKFTPDKCNATPNCKWSNGGNSTWDLHGCWYQGESCFTCKPGNTSLSACTGSSYCAERCWTSVSTFPRLLDKTRCVENFPVGEKLNGSCFNHECCGGADGNSGGVAVEETPDTCAGTNYCQWFDGSQPDGLRGCIYYGPLCAFCQPPSEAVQGSVAGQPCEPGKYEANATFCKTRCTTARSSFLGPLVCRNVVGATMRTVRV